MILGWTRSGHDVEFMKLNREDAGSNEEVQPDLRIIEEAVITGAGSNSSLIEISNYGRRFFGIPCACLKT